MRQDFLRLLLILLGPVLFAQEGNRVAIIAGVNTYDRLSPLKAALNDARAVESHFRAAGYSHIWVLAEDSNSRTSTPSVVNFQILMENLERLARAEPIQELVVFFAGHGVQIEGENYLCFPETDLQGKRGLLSVDRELIPWMRRVPARTIMAFLDACREDLSSTRSAAVTRGLVLPERLDVEGDRNILIAYSARPGEFAYEKPDGSGGFFTEVLLEGLRQAEQLSLGQLIQFIRTQLPERTRQVFGKIQMPSFGGDFNLDVGIRSTTHIATVNGITLEIRSELPVSQVMLNDQALGLQDGNRVEIQPGDYRLRLVSGNQFWETDISASGSKLTVIPDWKPYGVLEYNLPPAAEVELVSSDGNFYLIENVGVVPYLPAGEYQVRTVDEVYQGWQQALTVREGQKAVLAPQLSPRPGMEGKIQLARLRWEKERMEMSLPQAAGIRQNTGWVPVTAGGIGLAFALAGGGLWAWSEVAYADYQKATSAQAAQSTRELVQQLDLWKIVSLGIGGTGFLLWMGYEVFTPHPDRMQEAIKRLDQEILTKGGNSP